MPPITSPAEAANPGPQPPVRRARGHIESYEQGRTCSEPTCDTTLSRYNKDSLCAQHQDEQSRRRPNP